MPRTGFHLGLAEGHDKAVAYAVKCGCTAVQIFTHSPRSFQFKPLDNAAMERLRGYWKKHGISPVVSHCTYLINLGSSDNKTFYGSLSMFRKELEYAAAHGCQYLVIHVGKYKDADLKTGMAQVAKAINKARDDIIKYKVMVLLETVAGQGTEIGVKFEELAELLAMMDADLKQHIGVCVDTCHIFAAGYDYRDAKKADAVVKNLDRTVGLERIKLIQVNDSKGDLGSRLDRHEHLGQGKAGLDGLRAFLTHPKIKNIPMILETPVDENGDQLSDLTALNKFF